MKKYIKNFKFRDTTFTLAVTMAILGASLQACGKSLSRVTAIGGLSGGVAPTSIPGGKSVQAANSSLLGTFQSTLTGCLTSNGDFLSATVAQDASVSLTIADQAVLSQITDGKGCEVIATYSLSGVDGKAFVLDNRQLTVTFNGNPDINGSCTWLVDGFTAKGASEFKYTLVGSELSLLTPPTAPCETGEENDSRFSKI